jgi:hypothetical protein
MSVMLEHQIVPQSPCTPDCPDRSGDCMLHCRHGYAEYRAARDKVYAARAAAAEASRDASAKKARMKHRHKR